MNICSCGDVCFEDDTMCDACFLLATGSPPARGDYVPRARARTAAANRQNWTVSDAETAETLRVLAPLVGCRVPEDVLKFLATC